MSVVEIIRHYQRSLEKSTGNLERMLHCVSKLYGLPITVQHLQETGVGRTVNGLRKYEGDCGEAAKACVAKWKAMVAAEESSDPESAEPSSSQSKPEPSPSRAGKKEGTREEQKWQRDKPTEESKIQKKHEERSHSRRREESASHSKNGKSKKHKDEERSKTREDEAKKDRKHSRSKVSDSGEESVPEKKVKHREENRLKSSPSKSDNKHRKSDKHRRGEERKVAGSSGVAKTEDGSIDCLSGASFAEALGMVSPVKRKSSPVTSPMKSSGSHRTPLNGPKKLVTSSPAEFDFLSSDNLAPLDIDMHREIERPPPTVTIDPNYRPLPNAYNPFDSPPQKKPRGLTSEEALSQVMYHKTERTKVFSGVKGTNFRRGDPPSLFECCTRVLQDNIDALGYTGGVPYDILEAVLKRASPDQLFELEHHNPYLVEDTDKLWEFHCNKQFRSLHREEMESYRELFMRGLDERAAKFEILKSNIKQAQAASVPVRKAKMTYMDSVAKPPREVARQQARNGTARVSVKGSPCASVSSSSIRPMPVMKQKPRVAPLMQKAMKFAKTFKR